MREQTKCWPNQLLQMHGSYLTPFCKQLLFDIHNLEMKLHLLVKRSCQKGHYKAEKKCVVHGKATRRECVMPRISTVTSWIMHFGLKRTVLFSPSQLPFLSFVADFALHFSSRKMNVTTYIFSMRRSYESWFLKKTRRCGISPYLKSILRRNPSHFDSLS